MLRLRLLGTPRLTRADGGIVPLWRPESALLAVAGSSPEGVRRDEIAALLWPGSPADRARLALRQSLFRLRRRLRPLLDEDGNPLPATGDLLRAEGDRLVLDGGRIHVDLWDLERALTSGDARRTLELHELPFLHEFSLDGNPDFGHWLDGRRAEHQRRIVHLLSHLTREAEAAGERKKALERAVRWAEFAPLDEGAAQHLVRLHALCGDPTAALAAYETFRNLLREELGLEPSHLVQALALRIREGTQTPGLVPSVAQGREVWPMMGRSRELRELLVQWEAVKAGSHRLVLVEGEAGIGKSRLAREFIGGVRLEEATILEGRAFEVEREVPYSALSTLLTSALDAPGLSGVDVQALGELARIVPAFARRFSDLPVPEAADRETGRFRILDAVHVLLENLTYEAPVVLLLDDLPWADEATVAALHYTWRNLAMEPLLLLATGRPEESEAAAPGHRMWASLRREFPDEVQALPLGPISRDAMAHLAGPGADVEELQGWTGGNPLFLRELLRAREEGGTPSSAPDFRSGSLRAIVEDRLRRLGRDERRLLEAAAILGRSFVLPTASEMAGLEPEAAARAAGGLRQRGIIRETGIAYDFVHDLLRKVVEEGVPRPTRARLHQAAFRRLSPAPEKGADAAGSETLARHAEGGGLYAQAFQWSLRAAASAETLHAAEEAAAHLARARRMARTREERLEVWTRIAALERAQARFPEAAVAFLQAIRETAPETDERLGLRLRLLDAALRGGVLDPDEVVKELGGLLEEARGTGDPALLREACLVSALARQGLGDLDGAYRAADQGVQAGEAAGEPAPLVRGLLLQAHLALASGRRDEVLPFLDRAVERARAGGLVRKLFDAQAERGTELSRLGRWREAVTEWRVGLDRAIREGDYGGEAIFRLNLSDLLARRGDRHEAEHHLERLQEICRRFHFPHVEAAIPLNRALAAWFAGDAPETIRRSDVVLNPDTESPPPPQTAHARVARALALLGRLLAGASEEEIRDALLALENEGREGGHPNWSDDREMVALARIRAYQVLGKTEVALQLLSEARARLVEPFGRGLLHLQEASLLDGRDPARARILHEEAERILEPLELLWPPAPSGLQP